MKSKLLRIVSALAVLVAVSVFVALHASAGYFTDPDTTAEHYTGLPFTISQTIPTSPTDADVYFLTLPRSVPPVTDIVAEPIIVPHEIELSDTSRYAIFVESGATDPIYIELDASYTLDLAYSGVYEHILISVDQSAYSCIAEYVILTSNGYSQPFTTSLTSYTPLEQLRDAVVENHPDALLCVLTDFRVEVRSDLYNGSSDWISVTYYADDPMAPTTPVQFGGTVFDGNVGVADLLIGSLEPFFAFELFPSFTIGGVCAIVLGFGLLFAVLKLFAGG